jgi:hypothetical protein
VAITVGDVVEYLALPEPLDPADEAWIGDVVDAVNEWVAGLPIVVDQLVAVPPVEPPEPVPWPARARTGAIMLAGHIYQSRNSPNGRPNLDGGLSPAYADPEVSRLLELRRWARPGMRA